MLRFKDLMERLNIAKTKMGDVIKDFQDSDAPQFKGKSAEKRRQMAIAAKLEADRGVKEDTDLEEASYKDGDTRMGSVGPITTDAERAERAKKYREKKMAKEEVEQIDEISTNLAIRARGKALSDTSGKDRSKLAKLALDKWSGKAKVGSGKYNTNEEAEQIDELSTPTLQSYRKKARAQGNAIVDKMKMGGGDWSKDQKDTKTLRKRAAGAQMSGKKLVKRGESLKTEDVEQTDEELKGSQHKIDANKNGKIDGHDFKILRNAKKARYQ